MTKSGVLPQAAQALITDGIRLRLRFACTSALCLAASLSPLYAQKTVTPTNAQAMRNNLAEGKPKVLNGIRETSLPNGLTILTKEVHSAPVVFFAVYYRVGSVNEEVGQTGMSHLMEHMMFKGTKTRGPGVISSSFQRIGAEFNASTWFDRTEYHELLAADRLEMAMQIESDRMVNSVYDEAQHQKEMTVVRSEYEGGENNPGNVLNKAVRLAAYQVHPYRWETIGFRADIENFTRDEMYAYYKNYYQPNNATVVIVGDIDTAKALAMVRKYFGPIQPHPVMEHFITPEPAQEGERRVVLRRAGTTPQMEIVYHIPGFGHPDRYVFDVLETVLSGGRTSRFFRDLTQSGLAASADAYDYGLRSPDLLTLDAVAQPGHTNEDLEKALLKQVDDLQSTPITAQELHRALSQAEAGYIFGKDSVQQQGRELGENAMKGDWRYGETYLEHLRKVTAADVQRVAKKYLIPRNRTVGYFEPILTGQPAPPPSNGGSGPTPAAPRVMPDPSEANPDFCSDTGIFPRRTLLADLPSAAAPSPLSGGSASTAQARPTRVVLPNGLTIVVEENHANPTISLSGAIMTAGGVFDPPDKRGLASFTGALLSRGTEKRSLMEIARTLEDVGASVSVGAQDEYVSLGGHALSKDFNVILDVLSDELRHPAFPSEELERARRQTLAGIQQERENTGALAGIAFSNLLYPKGHPFSSPTLDEEAAVIQGLTRDDLVGFHAAHYAPDRMILSIVGDVRTSDAVAAVKKYFGDWARKGDLPPVKIPDVAPKLGPAQVKVIEVPDKAQVDVRYGYPGGIKRNDPKFYRTVVLNTILGGGAGLSSRLALSVRDKLGLVYGIGAFDAASLGAGPFTVEFGSNPANVDKAIAETQRQISLLKNHGVTPAEFSDAIAYLTGSYPVTLSTNGAVAGQLLISQIYGLGLDYIQKRNSYYRAVTLVQVNDLAKTYLQPDRGALVIAGTYHGKYAAATPVAENKPGQ